MDDKAATQIFEHAPLAAIELEDSSSAPYLILLSGGVPGTMHRLAPGPNRIGRASENQVQVLDAGLSRHHAEIDVSGTSTATLIDLGSTNGTFLNAQRIPKARAVGVVVGDRLRFGPSLTLRFCRPDADEERLQRELFERAVRDPLTGLYNRSYFFDQLGRLQGRAAPRGLGLAVLMLDIDHFKDVNDRHGHDVGDRILREVSAAIRRVLRADDLVGRYGGEEFVAALPIDGLDRARLRAERIRREIGDASVATPHGKIGVTCSIGLAFSPPGHSTRSADLVTEADGALYRAKRMGRDRVALAEGAGLNRVG